MTYGSVHPRSTTTTLENIISQCRLCPQGQTAKRWMYENGICEQTYYRWQRVIRQETYAEMTKTRQFPATASPDTDVSFVEGRFREYRISCPLFLCVEICKGLKYNLDDEMFNELN